MSKRLMAALMAALLLPLAAAAPVGARTPLYGTMDLQFNLGWPGPQAEIPDWVGTVEIDGTVYGMAFFAIGSGKPFAADPSASVHFFEEIWTIYDGLDFAFDAAGALTEFDPGPVVLSGRDSGITNMVNSKYQMTGSVTEAAAPLSGWAGRAVSMSGVIEWYASGAPQFAPGELRVH